MTLNFCKYQGTGNDFILFDNRDLSIDISQKSIEQLCNRRFGIGADGLMLLQNKQGYDFEMIYFNADGKESSMCGNGGRCIAAFANSLGIINEKGTFWAIDGEHLVEVKNKTKSETMVSLKMIDVSKIETYDNSFILNTGSPHFVVFTDDLHEVDVVKKGKEIRYNDTFIKEGINVNFVEVNKDAIKVRTYERGVEDETLSCGTGVTAASIAAVFSEKITKRNHVNVEVPGGNLKVHFSREGSGNFKNIWLEGPAKLVYTGIIEI